MIKLKIEHMLSRKLVNEILVVNYFRYMFSLLDFFCLNI